MIHAVILICMNLDFTHELIVNQYIEDFRWLEKDRFWGFPKFSLFSSMTENDVVKNVEAWERAGCPIYPGKKHIPTFTVDSHIARHRLFSEMSDHLIFVRKVKLAKPLPAILYLVWKLRHLETILQQCSYNVPAMLCCYHVPAMFLQWTNAKKYCSNVSAIFLKWTNTHC